MDPMPGAEEGKRGGEFPGTDLGDGQDGWATGMKQIEEELFPLRSQVNHRPQSALRKIGQGKRQQTVLDALPAAVDRGAGHPRPGHVGKCVVKIRKQQAFSSRESVKDHVGQQGGQGGRHESGTVGSEPTETLGQDNQRRFRYDGVESREGDAPP